MDAIKKIYSNYGIAGIYKGQVVTLWREAVGYGVYFWAYEKLMQRELARKGIRRDQVNPANAVLFGAAAGYAVRYLVFPVRRKADVRLSAAMGRDIPYRYDKIADADRRILGCRRSKVQVDIRLRAYGVADRGHGGLHTRTRAHAYSVCTE